MPKSELADVTLQVEDDSPKRKAIAFSDGSTEKVDGKPRTKWFWLPRSLIETGETEAGALKKGVTITVTMPEWLAIQEGLV